MFAKRTKEQEQMNVSETADREFIATLEREDPPRYERLMKNIRHDNPGMGMREDQALTNFMLGLPTGQYRFAVIAGPPAPEPVELSVREESAIVAMNRRIALARRARTNARRKKLAVAA